MSKIQRIKEALAEPDPEWLREGESRVILLEPDEAEALCYLANAAREHGILCEGCGVCAALALLESE